MQAVGIDPDLPDEVDFSRGKRGSVLPEEPRERAERLEQRVRALQAAGRRLREAAEQVAAHAELQHGMFLVPERDMRLLLEVLGVERDSPKP